MYIIEIKSCNILLISFCDTLPRALSIARIEANDNIWWKSTCKYQSCKSKSCLCFIKHRGYVVPEDVRAVAHDVLRHRIGLSYEAEATDLTTEKIISEIINKVQVP